MSETERVGTCEHCQRPNQKLFHAFDGRWICTGQWYWCHQHYLKHVIPEKYRKKRGGQSVAAGA